MISGDTRRVSCASGEAGHASDIDVGVLPQREISARLAEIRFQLEEASILRTVDLVDMSLVDAGFRQKIESEGILWRT